MRSGGTHCGVCSYNSKGNLIKAFLLRRSFNWMCLIFISGLCIVMVPKVNRKCLLFHFDFRDKMIGPNYIGIHLICEIINPSGEIPVLQLIYLDGEAGIIRIGNQETCKPFITERCIRNTTHFLTTNINRKIITIHPNTNTMR